MNSFSLVLLWCSGVVYVLSCILYVSFLVRGVARLGRYAPRALLTGLAFHTAFLAARAIQSGHLPFGDLFESVSFFVWLVVVSYVILIERTFREQSLGAFVVPLVTLFHVFSLAKVSVPTQLPAVLKSGWFEIHVVLALLAYASFVLTLVSGIVYLILARQLHTKDVGFLFSRLPSLQLLDAMGYRSVSVGFPALTLALIVGSVWASNVWGAFWRWDPKETATLVTWLFYAGYLHARFVAGWRGKRTAVLGILGFVMVVVTYLVVGTYLDTTHVF